MSKRKGIANELRRTIRQAERRGMTRYKLAQLSGVEQAVLSKVIYGKTIVRLDTAEKIVRALGKRLTIVDN